MKAIQLLSATVLLFSTFGAAAPSLPSEFDLQQPIAASTTPVDEADGNKVPGSNPLYHCDDTTNDDQLIIKKVDLNPNPPQAGKELSVEGTGQLLKEVEDGAKVHISVKYGLITILQQEVDLCAQASVVNQTCPLKKGDMSLTKTVNLPSLIPPGDYSVFADVRSKDEKRITCLKASVSFGTGFSSFSGVERNF